jgi:mono/diheme cytochrome c family protein
MRTIKLSAIALSLALAACAGDAGEEDTTNTTADQPANTQTQPAQPTASGTPPEGATAEDVSAGQQIFTSTGNCYTCHGPDGRGTALAPNLTDSEWINIDGTFAAIQQNVRTGVPQPKQHPAPMPAMGGANLNDDQIRQVSAYVWSLGGGK